MNKSLIIVIFASLFIKNAQGQFKRGQFSVGSFSPIELVSAKDPNINSIDFNPQVQFFISKNFSVGFMPGLKYFKPENPQYGKDPLFERTISGSFFGRIIKPINSKFYVLSDISFYDFSFQRYKYTPNDILDQSGYTSTSITRPESIKTINNGLNIKVVFGYLIRKNFSIEVNYGSLGWINSRRYYYGRTTNNKPIDPTEFIIKPGGGTNDNNVYYYDWIAISPKSKSWIINSNTINIGIQYKLGKNKKEIDEKTNK